MWNPADHQTDLMVECTSKNQSHITSYIILRLFKKNIDLNMYVTLSRLHMESIKSPSGGHQESTRSPTGSVEE